MPPGVADVTPLANPVRNRPGLDATSTFPSRDDKVCGLFGQSTFRTEQDALIRAGQLGAMGEKGVSAGPVRFYTTSEGGLSTITVRPRD